MIAPPCLGTHANTMPTLTTRDLGGHGPTGLPPALCRQREWERPSEQPCPRVGDLVLRDLRLWHGGMPNSTTEPRTMLVMVHIAADYRGPRESTFFTGFEAEQGSESFWQHSVLRTAVAFAPVPIAYRSGGHSAPDTALKVEMSGRRERGELYEWGDRADASVHGPKLTIGVNAKL
jgi:hypothetical protein